MSTAPPGGVALDHKRLEEQYAIYRDYMKHEDDLLNQRTTWHLLIQGFLFATLGVIGQWPLQKDVPDQLHILRYYLVYVLAGAAILIASFAFISTWAAHKAIDSLYNTWNGFKAFADPTDWALLPTIAGGGHPWAKMMGKAPAVCIPGVLILAWIAVIVMTALDGHNPQQNIETNISSQTATRQQIHVCSEATKAEIASSTRHQLVNEISCSLDNVDAFQQQLTTVYGVQVALTHSHKSKHRQPHFVVPSPPNK